MICCAAGNNSLTEMTCPRINPAKGLCTGITIVDIDNNMTQEEGQNGEKMAHPTITGVVILVSCPDMVRRVCANPTGYRRIQRAAT